jgi:hypothetical protein
VPASGRCCPAGAEISGIIPAARREVDYEYEKPRSERVIREGERGGRRGQEDTGR